MSEQRDKALDNSVAHALRIGAYIGFSILLIALLSRPFVRAETFLYISRIGVLAMMATPGFRVLVAFLVYLKERDYKYALISAGVLLILILGSVFGVGEH